MGLGLGMAQYVADTTPSVTTESRRLRGKIELVLPGSLATGRRLIGDPGLGGSIPSTS